MVAFRSPRLSAGAAAMVAALAAFPTWTVLIGARGVRHTDAGRRAA